MIFETERLIIRTLTYEDIDRMVEYRNKEEVAQYQSWKKYTLKEAQKRVNYIEKHPFEGKSKDNTQLSVLLKDGTIIGDLHLEVLSKTTSTIGYTFDSLYWGQGYAREAVRGLLDYIETYFNQIRVIAYIYQENDKSRRLLLDLGFRKFDESYLYHDEGYVKTLSN